MFHTWTNPLKNSIGCNHACRERDVRSPRWQNLSSHGSRDGYFGHFSSSDRTQGMTKTCFKLNQSTEIDHRQLSSTSIGYLQMCGSITRPKVEKIRQSRINKFPRFRSPHLCFGHLIYDSHARKYQKLLRIRSNPMKFIAHAFQHLSLIECLYVCSGLRGPRVA